MAGVYTTLSRPHNTSEAAERVGGLANGRPARRLVGDVALDGDRAGPGFLRGRFDALAAPGQERDLVAALRQRDRNATPESARRANHHCPRHIRPFLSTARIPAEETYPLASAAGHALPIAVPMK
jgi:hypothetical protein